MVLNTILAALILPSCIKIDKITTQEIISVFENTKKVIEFIDVLQNEIFSAIGYSSSKRILIVSYIFPGDKIEFINAEVASEQEIDKYYCGK